MKNKTFLIKLNKEEKLQLVTPSEEIKEAHIEKSESNLISAKILLENSRLEESVSLAYYSMYHLATALFFKVGIKCENHSATIILLSHLFHINNKDIAFAKKERIDKQYYTNFSITKQEVISTIKLAENFNKSLYDFISKMNLQDIEKYRNKLKELI